MKFNLTIFAEGRSIELNVVEAFSTTDDGRLLVKLSRALSPNMQREVVALGGELTEQRGDAFAIPFAGLNVGKN